MTRQGDLSNAGLSTMQKTQPWYVLHGFPEGMLSAAEANQLGPQPLAGRVAYGQFSSNEAAMGLIIGTLLLLYLGTRVVVAKP